jgi:hypothetical protein
VNPFSSTALAVPDAGRVSFGDLFRLVGLPSETERAAKQLSGSAEALTRSVTFVIDGLVVRAIESRTAEEFRKTSTEVFPQYFAAMHALGQLIRIIVPADALERLMSESLSELEADLRELGPSAFGSDLSARGSFTVWTLRKIKDLAQEFSEQRPSADGQTDADLTMKFVTYAVWTRFHVDCLARSMHGKKPIYPEVVPQITDGLRAAVDAYAWIRQAVELRSQPELESDLAPIPWDEEDELLLRDSMRRIGDPS